MPDEERPLSDFATQVATEDVEQPLEAFAGVQVEQPTAIAKIPQEHEASFIEKFGSAIYNEFQNSVLALGGAETAAAAGIAKDIGSITGLNEFQAYQDWWGYSERQGKEALALMDPESNLFTGVYHDFLKSIGGMMYTLPVDIMTGRAVSMVLAGRVLPAMEAVLATTPDFVIGGGLRGMIEGVNNTDGSYMEKVVGGIEGGVENTVVNSLFAQAGTGLKGIGKMASIGLAQSFFDAAKEGRLPTSEELREKVIGAATMGAVFTALPHLVEASQVAKDKRVLKEYSKKFEGIVLSEKEFPNVKVEGPVAPVEGAPVAETPAPAPRPLTPIDIKLPTDLSSAKPKYNYGDKAFSLNFESDLDRAAYISAQKSLSRRDADYVKWVSEKTGLSEMEIRQRGARIKARIKEIAATSDPGRLDMQYSGLFPLIPGSVVPQAEAPAPAKSSHANVQKLYADLLTDKRLSEKTREALGAAHLEMLWQRGAIVDPTFDLGKWKDPSDLTRSTQTMERTIEQIMPAKNAAEVKAYVSDAVKANETAGAKWLSDWVRWVKDNPEKRLGVRVRSGQDKVLFSYAEGKATLEDLQKAFPKNWQTAVDVVAEGKIRYKAALDGWNAVRTAYGIEPVLERADYVRHMRELRDATDLMGWFFEDRSPADALERGRQNKLYRPRSSAEKARITEEGEKSYILAMQDYGENVKNARFHLDSVQRARRVENYLRAQAEANELAIRTRQDAIASGDVSKAGAPVPQLNLDNFQLQMKEYGDVLAGQPSEITKGVITRFGRPGYAAIRYLSSKPIVNMVAGNISMLLMNILSAPQALAYGVYHPKRMAQGVYTAFLRMGDIANSKPLTIDGHVSDLHVRRFSESKIPANWMEDVAQKGMVFAYMSDRFMADTIVSSRYYQNKAMGMDQKKAMQEASDTAVRIIGDRSLGQKPIVFSDPTLQVFTGLQFEVNNLWSSLTHDLPREYKGQAAKLVGAYVAYAIGASVVNDVIEKATGRRPGLDPLYILASLAGAGGGVDNGAMGVVGNLTGVRHMNIATPWERITTASQNLTGNIPFTSLGVFLGLEEGRFPLQAAFPDVEAMGEDPSRIPGEVIKTLLYLNPLGFGSQMKKSFEGVQAYMAGYVATSTGKGARYPVDQDLSNFLRAFIFGKNAVREAQEYWSYPKSVRRQAA